MVLVNGDVASNVVGSYMMWIACIFREIELMTLVGVIYILYIDALPSRYLLTLFFYCPTC